MRHTRIAYAHSTWNPWWGCTPISEGCQACYAAKLAKRCGFDCFGAGKPRRYMSAARWEEPRRWNAEAAKAGKPRRVMVSMCDPFDPEVPFFRREEFMRLVAATPALTWLLLTKRPEHVVARFDGWTGTWVWPRNAWLGFSAENQRCLEERQVAVSRTLDRIEGRPPIVFASLAPMLSPIDVSKLYLVDWVIVEAESGAAGRPGRPFDEAWARTVRDDCVARGTPFFYKQGVSGGRIVEVPQLDGEQWVQIPEVSR